MIIHEINTGWVFKEAEAPEDAWLSVTRVPTNVHLDLITHKRILDPFVGYNELDCQWVAEKAWIYRVMLPDVSPIGRHQKTVLAFDGLDTFATVKLNGEVVLKSENMFVAHRLDVTEKLKVVNPNELTITFESALLRARQIKNAYPNHKWVGSNGEMSRLAVRKAQYHWGWDWGPVLMTCGPWRPVRLETYEARIADLRIDYELDSSLSTLTGTITAFLESDMSAPKIWLIVELDGEILFRALTNFDADGTARVNFHVNNPKLWFPHGYGPQNLYDIKVIFDDGSHDCILTKRVGFRKVELVQEKDRIGKSFYFRINHIDVFCGGSDWIPADSFTPRLSAEKYRRWLQMMVEGNQVMIRIWGGGIWEEKIFYDTCDELGILVWQDFMFACGNYPAHPSFLESVREECVFNIRRLRHHPSLTIYAGNNEDYQIQEQLGLQYDYADKDPENWLKSDFPARYIYEKLLPEIIQAENPSIPYHPGSPWGDGKLTSDPTVGDLHQWNVWHGTQEKYQIYESLGGRFNSEFGMQGFPHRDTLLAFINEPSQLYPQSRMFDFHNKATGHERRIATYISENFRVPSNLRSTIYLTQLCQAEALMYGYRGWRRQWGQNRRCGGALVWQLNDCWPVTSWSIVDYFFRKKPAFYAIARTLAPVTIGVKREHHDWSVADAPSPEITDYELWLASSRMEVQTGTVELRFISISTGTQIKTPILMRDIKIAPNSTTEVLKGSIENFKEEPHVLAARLWINNEIVARDSDWPQPFKYLSFEERGVEVKFDNDCIRITAQKPTKGLILTERDCCSLSDNAVDIMPGDEQTIQIRRPSSPIHHANRGPFEWTYLGSENQFDC